MAHPTAVLLVAALLALPGPAAEAARRDVDGRLELTADLRAFESAATSDTNPYDRERPR